MEIIGNGNTKFFKRLNEVQIKNIKNDLFKNELAINSGYEILRFWENEIHQDNFENEFLRVLNEKS